jgi:hypothetical protein
MSINKLRLTVLLAVALAGCNHPDATQTAAAPAPAAPAASSTPAVAQDAPIASRTAAVTSAPTSAAKPCAGADVGLSEARKTAYAALVSGAVEGKAKAADITVDRFMAQDGWTVVLAHTPIADPGWFVFDTTGDKPQFKDVWGGMADESDRQDLAKWARALGAPAAFAQCFAQTIIG